MGVKIQKKKQEMWLINEHTMYFVVKPENGIFGSNYYQAFLNHKISSSCFCFYCWNISSGLQIISISSILPETEWMTNKYLLSIVEMNGCQGLLNCVYSHHFLHCLMQSIPNYMYCLQSHFSFLNYKCDYVIVLFITFQ